LQVELLAIDGSRAVFTVSPTCLCTGPQCVIELALLGSLSSLVRPASFALLGSACLVLADSLCWLVRFAWLALLAGSPCLVRSAGWFALLGSLGSASSLCLARSTAWFALLAASLCLARFAGWFALLGSLYL